MANRPRVGDPAPDFALEGTHGTFTLYDHRGEQVVLVFYPGDDTPVCTRQFCSYRDDAETLDALDATVVGISGRGLESKQRFADKYGLTVPLLADPGGKVAKAYGAWSRVLGTRRAVVIVDRAGIVRHRHDHTLGLGFQTAEDIRSALERVS
jgi:peroxiredoxin Q/BCP